MNVRTRIWMLKNMVLLAIATSIDALAVGVTFAFLNVDIPPRRILYRKRHLLSVRGRRKGGQRIWMPL